MGTYREILRLRMTHSYYQADLIPLEIVPADPHLFQTQCLLLRRQGTDYLVVSDSDELPETIEFIILAKAPEIMAVTVGANAKERPVINAPIGQDVVQLDPLFGSSGLQTLGKCALSLLRVAPATDGRLVKVEFDAPHAHWAYHIVGDGSDNVTVEDPDGDVIFDHIGSKHLSDGRRAHVLRSRKALPARARPTQLFSLKSPGPFGPKTLIPVLPAAGPDFVSVHVTETAQTLVQSDIYVSIF